jgi:hypothetical protein
MTESLSMLIFGVMLLTFARAARRHFARVGSKE